MAAHPKFDYSTVEPYQRVIPPTKSVRPKSRQYSFTLGQLVVSWSICAGLMAATFFFGLYAGKERGMQLALEEQARLALRVPLPERPLPDVGPLAMALETAKTAQPEQTSVPLAKAPTQSLASLPAEGAAAALPQATITPKTEAPSETIAQRVKLAEVEKASVPKQKPIRGVEAPAPAPKVEKKESKPAAAAKVAISSSVKRGYYVQVSAKRSSDSAQDMAQSLAAAKYNVAIEQTKVGGKQFYRVLVGPYKSAKDAKSRQKRLIQAGLSPKSAFVKQVS